MDCSPTEGLNAGKRPSSKLEQVLAKNVTFLPAGDSKRWTNVSADL